MSRIRQRLFFNEFERDRTNGYHHNDLCNDKLTVVNMSTATGEPVRRVCSVFVVRHTLTWNRFGKRFSGPNGPFGLSILRSSN